MVGFCPDTGTGGDAYHFPSAFAGLICCGLSGNQDFPAAGLAPEEKIREIVTHAGGQKLNATDYGEKKKNTEISTTGP